MDRILQSDIDILVLRHLASYSCVETARSLVKEKPELRTYIQMQAPIRNPRLMGGCTPATDSIQTLRSSTLIHSSLKDVISEYANAKAVVKELTDSIVFEWAALKYDEINSQDSMMTQLRAIGKLLKKLCKVSSEKRTVSTCTTQDGLLPLYYGQSCKNTVDALVQTDEIEEEAVQRMFYNNLLNNIEFQEKIADSINEQLAQPQTTRNEEKVVKTVCSKTESEIDIFLREMLQDTDTEGGIESSPSTHNAEVTEQEYGEVEQNFISLFSDAQSIIELGQETTEENMIHPKSTQKPQIDKQLVDMLTTPKKVETPRNKSLPNSDRNPPPVLVSERYVAPCGKVYSVITPSYSEINDWSKLGRRQIQPKPGCSTNKRKAKFATPVKLTPVKAYKSSVNYHKPPESDKIGIPPTLSPESKIRREVSSRYSPEAEIVDVEDDMMKEPVPISMPFVKPIIMATKESSLAFQNRQTISQMPISALPKTAIFSGSLVRPSASVNQKPLSPIKIVRPEYRSGTPTVLTGSRLPSTVVSSLISSSSKLPIIILSPPCVSNPVSTTLNAIYSPITPVPAEKETKSSEPSSEIPVLSQNKITPKDFQLDPKLTPKGFQLDPKLTPSHHRTPAFCSSTSKMSPFLRKLVTSAQKAKTTLAIEVVKPNKKSYSTPRKKNHVRNLHFKTPPSMSKVSETPGTSSETSNLLKRKGDESILPVIKSKKRLEWSQEKAIENTTMQTPPVSQAPKTEIHKMESVARRIIEESRIANTEIPIHPLIKEAEPKAPKFIIKNKNTVISITPPASLPAPVPVIGETDASAGKEKAKNSKNKDSITPKRKRGRKSKKTLETDAAKEEAFNAVPVCKFGRGKTPRKKFNPSAVRSPLRNILPRPPPTIIESPPEVSLPNAASTVQNSAPFVLVLPHTPVPPSDTSVTTTSVSLQKTSSSNSLSSLGTVTSFSKTSSSNSLSPLEASNSSFPKTNSFTTSASETLKLTFHKITTSSSDVLTPSFPKQTSSSSLNLSAEAVKSTFMKSGSSSSLNTPLMTPLKTHISPEIPSTPGLCLTFLSDLNDQSNKSFGSSSETPFKLSIAKFFATPLKSGNPITPGKVDNPITIDESSTGSIFDTPDKDPNANPLDLTSPTPALNYVPSGPNTKTITVVHTDIKEPQLPNKNLKTAKSAVVKTGFKVSGRAKQLTMSEHETVLGLLHMREGIGSPHTNKLGNQKTNEAATPNKDLQQLLQNANVESFLQNFVHKK